MSISTPIPKWVVFVGAVIGAFVMCGVAPGQPEPGKVVTGDPRTLELDSLQAIRQALVTVVVPDDESESARSERSEELLKPRANGWLELDRDQFQIDYGVLDGYLLRREAAALYDLGLRAWTVDFQGGPLQLWWRIEVQGDVPLGDIICEQAGAPDISMICDHAAGKLLFWNLPGLAPDSTSARATELGAAPGGGELKSSGIPFVRGLQVVGSGPIERAYQFSEGSPLLWSHWKGVELTRHSPTGPIAVAGDTVLLDLEAVEPATSDEVASRRLRMQLIGRPR